MGSIASSIFGGGSPGGQPAGQAATPQAGAVSALAQSPQLPGVQAQQAPAVNTGATAQVPQPIPNNGEDEKRKQMIELLLKQGLDQNQIQTRLADLDDQKFFQSPAERAGEKRQVLPKGLLSAAAAKETEEDEEKPKGILGI